MASLEAVVTELPELRSDHTQVPDVPGVGAVLAQDGLLRSRRIEPVPGHESNLLAANDVLEGVKRRFLPCPCHTPAREGWNPRDLFGGYCCAVNHRTHTSAQQIKQHGNAVPIDHLFEKS